MLPSLIAPPSTPHPARKWVFGMFVIYTFWAFLLVMLPFSNDDTLREAGWPLIAVVSLLSPILAGLATRYALQKTARPPDDLHLSLTLSQWGLLGFNVTATAFALLVFQTIATSTDFFKLAGPMVLAVIVVNVGWLYWWGRRMSQNPQDPLYMAVGSGLLLIIATIGGTLLPIDLSSRTNESTIKITAPRGRVLIACQPLMWTLTNVEDAQFSQQGGFKFDTVNETRVNICPPYDPAAPSQENAYELHITVPDGPTSIETIYFSPLYAGDWLRLGLASLLLMVIPAYTMHSRTLWPLIAVIVWAGVGFLPIVNVSFHWGWALIGTLALAWLLPQLERWIAQPMLRRVLDVLLVIAIPLVTMNLAASGNRLVLNTWIAPINDLLAGKTLFVDATSTVGIGSVTALSWLFGGIPLSASAFMIVGFVAFAGMVIALSLLLRHLTGQLIPAIIFLAATTILMVWHVPLRSSPFQTGDILNTAFQYGLVLWVMLRYTNPANRRWWRGLEYLTVAVACLWSLPAAGLTLVPYIGLLVYEALASDESTWGMRIRQTATHIGIVIGLVVVGGAMFWLTTQPDPSLLWAYLAHPIPFIQSPSMFGPWAFAMLISALTVCWAAFEQNRKTRYAVPILMAVIGITQFTYWSRLQLDSYALPALWLGAYWLGRLEQAEAPNLLRQTGRFTLLFGFSWIVIWHVGQPPQTIATPVQWLTSNDEMATLPGPSATVLSAADLINEYTPDDDRIALFMDPNTTVETFAYISKTHTWRLTNAFIDQQVPEANDWILGYEGYSPEVGDILYVQRDNAGMNFLQAKVLDAMTSGYELEVLDATESGLEARRVVGLESDDDEGESE